MISHVVSCGCPVLLTLILICPFHALAFDVLCFLLYCIRKQSHVLVVPGNSTEVWLPVLSGGVFGWMMIGWGCFQVFLLQWKSNGMDLSPSDPRHLTRCGLGWKTLSVSLGFQAGKIFCAGCSCTY